MTLLVPHPTTFVVNHGIPYQLLGSLIFSSIIASRPSCHADIFRSLSGSLPKSPSSASLLVAHGTKYLLVPQPVLVQLVPLRSVYSTSTPRRMIDLVLIFCMTRAKMIPGLAKPPDSPLRGMLCLDFLLFRSGTQHTWTFVGFVATG